MSANERIQWMHKHIAAGHYPNAQRLAERFGISERQARRDVEALRKVFGAPISYSAKHRGFAYTGEFSLPTYKKNADDQDYVAAVTGKRGSVAKKEIVQLQIPFSAVIQLSDKLTPIELCDLIVREEGEGRFVCEFYSAEMFLGLLFSLDADVKVLKPQWLREQMLAAAERVLRNNAHVDEDDT